MSTVTHELFGLLTKKTVGNEVRYYLSANGKTFLLTSADTDLVPMEEFFQAARVTVTIEVEDTNRIELHTHKHG